MNMDAFGLIYTGDHNPKLKELTLSRSVAAVPFGGRYRCIDFILSDMVNSGIRNVGLIMQKNYHSIMDHLGQGKEWDLNRKRDGLFILPPFLTKDNTGVYRGDIDAYHSVMNYIRRSSQKYILLSGSSTVFNSTFHEMMQQHQKTGADITIMYNIEKGTDAEDRSRDLRLLLDDDGRVREMEWNPYEPRSDARSMEVMIMEKTLLEHLVEEAFARGDIDFTRDVLQRRTQTLKICGYRYDGYVARLDSINTFFRHSMELLTPEPAEDLHNREHPIYTKVKDEVSAKYGPESRVKNCVVADGCNIEGTVENCVLFRGVTVGKGAVVKNSVLMQGSTIAEDAVLDHVILDKNVTIRSGRTLVGYDTLPIVLKKNQVL